MKQAELKKRPRLRDGSVALLSVTVLALTLILVRHLALGVTLSGAIISIYIQLTYGKIQSNLRNTSVLVALWTVLATTVYTSTLEIIFLSAIICLAFYIVWKNYTIR